MSDKVSKISDEYFKDQWNLHLMNVIDSWEYSTGKDVIVGIVDSGIDGSHKDFGWNTYIDLTANDGITARKSKYAPVLNSIREGSHPKVLPGWNFIENNDDTYDAYRHGTYLAGTIGAVVNEFGIVGVSPDCRIKPYVVVNANGYCMQSDVAKAIVLAADDGCDVINLSLAWSYDEKVMQGAIDYANSKGIIVIAATGNNNKDTIYYPAALNGVVIVGGCGPSRSRWIHSLWRGSNYYPKSDGLISSLSDKLFCVCPGSAQITTMFMRWRFTDVDGTSQATANMTGIVALMKSLDKSIDYSKVVEVVKKTSFYIDNEVGYGVPDACAIMKLIATNKKSPDDYIAKLREQLLEMLDTVDALEEVVSK